MNKVMLIGRLGKDPELRYTPNGSPVANLRIATDESYTDRDGNKVDRTEWHTVVVFQRQAENCQAYLKKGSLVFVEGSLQTRKWQDQQGQDRYSTEIKAIRVQFLDRKGTNTGADDSYSDSSHKGQSGMSTEVNGGLSDIEAAFGKAGSMPMNEGKTSRKPRPKQQDNELGRGFATEASQMDKLPWDNDDDSPSKGHPDMPF